MKLYLYIAAALILSGLLWGAVHIWNKAQERDAFEQRAIAAEREKVKLAEGFADSVKQFAEQQAKDQEADTALAARITALEGVAADLKRAASRVPATVEKVDDKGIRRAAINPDWWLCQSAILSGDATDAAACQTRAEHGSVPASVSP